jgi:hypothetical protein
LLIALESPELCSTLAAIKKFVNRRHKNLSQMENFEKGEEQGSEALMYGCNGGEFVFCPAAKKELRKCFLDGLRGTCEQSFAVGDFCGSFLCLLMGDYSGVFYALEEIHRMIWNSLSKAQTLGPL